MSSSSIGNINTYLSLMKNRSTRGQALGGIVTDLPPAIQVLLQLRDNGGSAPIAQLEWELELKYAEAFRGSTFRDALKKLRDNAFLSLSGDPLSYIATITDKGIEQLTLWQ